MLPNVVIRVARCDEQKDLEELQRRASLMWEEYRRDLLAAPDAIELPLEQIEAGRAYVAELGGKPVGFFVVLPRADGDAELDGLFVEPVMWGRGIGRLLVREACHFATSEGASWLCVVGNPRAQGFYAACDFELEGEENTRFGVGLVMRKRIGLRAGDNVGTK
jgi:GNAT superfamily N-acetyltransferase